MSLDPEIAAGLDPGIRKIVEHLNHVGFVTTDSGDGVSKAPYEPGDGQIPYPHVAVKTSKSELLRDADRLFIYFLENTPDLGMPSIEATYYPRNEWPTASIILCYWAPKD